MRRKTAEWLQQHPDDFMPFLTNDAGDGLTKGEGVGGKDGTGGGAAAAERGDGTGRQRERKEEGGGWPECWCRARAHSMYVCRGVCQLLHNHGHDGSMGWRV